MSQLVDPALMAECVERAGWVKGPRLAHFVIDWRLCEVAHDGQVGIEQFSTWWTSRRTAYRRLAEFRELFPEFDTPADVELARSPARLPARTAGGRGGSPAGRTAGAR